MQRALLGFFALCATSLSFAPPAAAGGLRWPWEDDDCCPPCAPVCEPAPCAPVCAPVCAAPQPQPCVPQTIPACVEVRTRTVERPAVTCQVQVPKYEEVSHPVYETKCTPEYRTVETPVYETRSVPVYAERCVARYESYEVPVYRTRQVPTYATRSVPRYEDVAVPCYATRCVPVTQPVCDPCTGVTRMEICGYRNETYESGSQTERRLVGYDSEQYECGSREECYQDGTESRQRLAGYDREQYECGTREECYQSGTRTEQVFVGNRTEVVQTGVRTEQRCTGYTTEERVLQPARSDVVSERFVVPARRVTVAIGVPANEVRPLAGTSEVLTQAEFDAAVAKAARAQ